MRTAAERHDARVSKDVDVLTETVIRRPVAEVAAFAGDPTNAPEWYVNIDSVEWQTPPPVGSRMAFVARFLGRRLAYTYEVSRTSLSSSSAIPSAISCPRGRRLKVLEALESAGRERRRLPRPGAQHRRRPGGCADQ